MCERVRSNPAWLIIAIAFLIRLAWVLFSPALPVSDFATFHGLASRLADGLGYVLSDGTPTAFRPPGYPTFLAIIYWATNGSLLAAKLANAVLGTLSCWLTYALARRTFSETVALKAALLVACFPSQVLYSSLLATENLFTPLLLASTLLFLESLQSERRGYLPVAGVVLGLCSLTRPTSLLIPGMWFLFLIWKRYDLKKAVGTTAIVSAIALLTITPWILRNLLVMDAFIPTATEGGVGFLCGFNETANGHYTPYAIDVVNRLGAGLDEVEKEKLAYRLAFDYIRENPDRVMLLAPLNLFHLFRDDVSGVVWNFKQTARPLPASLWYILVFAAQFYYMAIMILAILSLLRWRNLPGGRWYGLLVANVMYRIGFHTIFVGDDRYHHSILPVVAIFAAHGALSIRHRWRVLPRSSATN